MTSKKKLAVIIAILLAILIGIALAFQSRQNSTDVNNGTGITPSPAVPAIEILTKPSSPQVRVGRTETVIVELSGESAKKPTAIDLTFKFDNKLVEVLNIVPGKVWHSSNVLRKIIDNDNGIVRLAAGQGFNTDVSDSLEIVEIEYRVLEPGDIIFELTSDSRFAFVGESELYPVTSSQIIIEGEN